jgi:hypothetical protein
MRSRILPLFIITLSLFSAFETAIPSMITETPESLEVNNGHFVLTIDKDSGTISSLRLVHNSFEFAGTRGNLFFPEFALEYPDGSLESWSSVLAKYLGGKTAAEVLLDKDEIAIIKGSWDTAYIDTEWEYRVIKGKPYFIVYLQRRVERTDVYANAQQCIMITDSMDDAYITDYTGELLCTCSDRSCLYPAGYIQHSLFTAIDNGRGTRYPAMVWHDDENDLVAGVLVPYVTPNQRETISHQNTGIHRGFWEGQWNWFGKSDNESLYLREGTTYGMEMYYYLNRGDVDTFDAFNQSLFNRNHYDLSESEDYWAASWGSRRCSLADFSWTYPQASNNYICSQELFRYKGISLPRSQNSTRCPEISDLSVKAIMQGQSFDLTPLPKVDGGPPLHETASFTETQGYMIGEVDWEVNSLENKLRYQMFEDSDKITVAGEITPSEDSVLVKEIFVELALPWYPASREIYRIDDFTWDIRRSDSIYGSVGITVYNPTGIDTIKKYGSSLRLYILKNREDEKYGSQQHWSYQFYLFPHLGYEITDSSQITPLHSKPARYYREYYQTLPGLRDHNEIGICPDKNFFVYDAALIPQGTGEREIEIALYAAPGSYPIRFFFKNSDVLGVRFDGSPLSQDNWHFDPDTEVLTVESDWQGIAILEVLLKEKSSGVSLDANFEPLGLACLQNHPNPFGFDTIISFRLLGQSEAELAVYNLMGQKVKTLVRSRLQEGYHSFCWDGADGEGHLLASGVYLCRLKVGETVKVQKILLLR